MTQYERIVSLAPSNTDILQELGVTDRLVASTALCDDDRPSVGGWTTADVEQVNQHDPDLVLASDALQDDIVAKCREAGANVVQLCPETFTDVFNTIKHIGELVEAEQTAEEIVTEMNESVKDLVEGTDHDAYPRIYCEEWHDPAMVGGNWIPGMAQLLGCEYLIEEGERSREVSTSEIREFDPDHIFLHVCGTGTDADPQWVTDRAGWNAITAVQNGSVHVINDSFLNRPAPGLIKGMKQINQIVWE